MRRQFGQYATDVMDKAHIQHTVRFVQHEDFNFIKTDGVLMFEVQQTARGGDEDVDAAAQLHHLRVDTHAAEDHQRANIQVFTVIADVRPPAPPAHGSGSGSARAPDDALCVRLILIRRCAAAG